MQVATLLLGSLFKRCDGLLSHRSHLVDLAGSERAGRTKATGDRRGSPKPPSHSQPTLAGAVSGWRKVQLSTKVYRRWPGAAYEVHSLSPRIVLNLIPKGPKGVVWKLGTSKPSSSNHHFSFQGCHLGVYPIFRHTKMCQPCDSCQGHFRTGQVSEVQEEAESALPRVQTHLYPQSNLPHVEWLKHQMGVFDTGVTDYTQKIFF